MNERTPHQTTPHHSDPNVRTGATNGGGTGPDSHAGDSAAKAGKGKSPTHAAYHVRETKDKKGFWTRIGSAWPHSDGQGFNVQLDCVPIDGRVTLRVAGDKE